MANYHPMDKNLTMVYPPYLFVNRKRLKGTYNDVTGLLHEYLHLSRLLVGEITDYNEENVVSWIETEMNWIIESGVVGILQQPASYLT